MNILIECFALVESDVCKSEGWDDRLFTLEKWGVMAIFVLEKEAIIEAY